MLFKDILDKKTKLLYPVFDELHNIAGQNQTHPSDLLLIHENAFYNPEAHTWDNMKKKVSPYMIGPNHEGHSAYTHHDFIGEYISRNLIISSYEQYLESLVYADSRRQEIDNLQFQESISIQFEMLIYLKIWESDNFIKQFYQLALLANGQPYDWHFEIKESNRGPKGTGTRETILRKKTRDSVEFILPELYSSIKRSYITQVRNSIAHSQYSILGRNINLNNQVEGDEANLLRNLTFDQWIGIFHETLVIYTQLQRLMNEVNLNYGSMALQNEGQMEVRINRTDPKKEFQYLNLYYRADWQDWGWQKE
ncbi:MAG TPA: hypothetical protein VNI52_13120 [Sphingobacteriaceae bacterium]|nr:hypothetical protein [Sphingobacteriaceae bacterium]